MQEATGLADREASVKLLDSTAREGEAAPRSEKLSEGPLHKVHRA